MIVTEEVVIGSIEPITFIHFLKSPSKLIRIMLYYWFYIPNLRSLGLGFIPEKDIQLYLSIFISKDIVPMPLDGGEDFKSAGGGFLYFLLMGKTASILD